MPVCFVRCSFRWNRLDVAVKSWHSWHAYLPLSLITRWGGTLRLTPCRRMRLWLVLWSAPWRLWLVVGRPWLALCGIWRSPRSPGRLWKCPGAWGGMACCMRGDWNMSSLWRVGLLVEKFGSLDASVRLWLWSLWDWKTKVFEIIFLHRKIWLFAACDVHVPPNKSH